MKEIDVDALLGESALQFTLSGKTFVVRDLTIKQLMQMDAMQKDPETKLGVVDQVRLLLGDDAKDLNIGLKAARIILDEIMHFLGMSALGEVEAPPKEGA